MLRLLAQVSAATELLFHARKIAMASSSQQFVDSPCFAARASALTLRVLAATAIVAGVILLLVTAYVLGREATWLPRTSVDRVEKDRNRNEKAFFHGTIGTEVVPLPVLQVLPEICATEDGSPSHFYPFGKAGGSWIEQFGFLPASLAPASAPVDPLARDLPLGFTISHYRPKSGAPSPVAFVGLACASCHTTRINGKLVIGTGNTALNLFGWIDAFQAALKDERVNYSSILAAYEKHPENAPLSLEQKGMIWLWLDGARRKQAEDATKFDEPFGDGLSMRAEYVPTGPCRTQPFRTLVRGLLHRPGSDMKVYTKIAAIYKERQDEWGQFDGGIHGLYRRSAGAAFAAGATVQNMTLREIQDNIVWASDFIEHQAGPKWADIFPAKSPDQQAIGVGRTVYIAYCDRCHGHPDPAAWIGGERDGKIVPVAEIKTDPERVTFRYFEQVPDALSAHFPSNPPFNFPRDELRPRYKGEAVGFINKRMHSMFSRAPYLHNASVLTLAELINLEPRKPIFFRGDNEYDDRLVGLRSRGEKEHDPNDRKLYFRFDTSAPGNSNKGHDYPWTREQVEKDKHKQDDLRNLLEYLKTL
jgi:hypothetical protein